MSSIQTPRGSARPVSRPKGDARIEQVTAKEKLLEHAPNWSEEQAERALLAAGASPKSILDAWGDLDAQTDATTAASMRELDEEERASGLEPWRF
jgi:hypothetical protein